VLDGEDRRRGPKPGAAMKLRIDGPGSPPMPGIERFVPHETREPQPPVSIIHPIGRNPRARRSVSQRRIQKPRMSSEESLDSRLLLWHFPAARTCSGRVRSLREGLSVPPRTSYFRVRRCARDGRPALHRASDALHYASGSTPGSPHKWSPKPTCRCAFSRSGVVNRTSATANSAIRSHMGMLHAAATVAPGTW